MKAPPLLIIVLIMVACSDEVTLSSADVRAIMKADDTNAIDKVISERGVNGYITLPFTDKRTPLLVSAAEFHATNILRLLLEQGADPNSTNYRGQTALIQLCAHGTITDSNLITHLISKGAKVNHKPFDGWDALHYAALNDSPEIVALLLQNGADPNTKANDGRLLRERLSKPEIKQMLNNPRE
jgi:ankyrin repeat protein